MVTESRLLTLHALLEQISAGTETDLVARCREQGAGAARGDALRYVDAHPQSGVYLRQVEAHEVDSNFIEAQRGVLTELLDSALPPEAVHHRARGTAQLARRFGFRDKPVRIRFRRLDPAIPSLPSCQGAPDLTLDTPPAALARPVDRVFVTEYETNLLAFLEVAQASVVFGAGCDWDALARAAWLHRCRLHYLGRHRHPRFAILDQLRGLVPQPASFLSDRETLLAPRTHWGEEPEPARHDSSRLAAE